VALRTSPYPIPPNIPANNTIAFVNALGHMDLEGQFHDAILYLDWSAEKTMAVLSDGEKEAKGIDAVIFNGDERGRDACAELFKSGRLLPSFRP
jgi:hypothetical protein